MCSTGARGLIRGATLGVLGSSKLAYNREIALQRCDPMIDIRKLFPEIPLFASIISYIYLGKARKLIDLEIGVVRMWSSSFDWKSIDEMERNYIRVPKLRK